MKIIITESQFEQIIPNSVRRRLSEISDVLYAISKRTISEKFKVAPDEYVKLFKNDNFELVVPLTFEASKKYGANAKWCTTSKCDDTMFNKHNQMGSLAYLIVKNPEISQRLGNTKYGLFINKPNENYLGGKHSAPTGIMMYGDNNSILSQSQVENEFDKLDLLSDYYKMMRSYLDYSQDKFSKESVNEDIAIALRRRLNFDEFITEVDFIIEHEITPCGFDNPQDFIETVCDYMKDSVSENFSYDLTPKEKDELYFRFVDIFGEYLLNNYKKNCSKKLRTESVRKIIITESQFEQIIPSSVRRRLSEISDVLYEMLNNTNIGEEAEEYPEDDYVDYVIEILLPEVISEIDWSDVAEYEEIFKKLVGDKIRKFWKEQNQDSLNESEDEGIDRESIYEIMDDIVNIAYGGFNITDNDSYLRIYRKNDLEIDKNIIAQKNSWGKMFLSEDIVDELTKYFSLENREKCESLVSEYFKDRYGIIIKTFALNW